jgi:hypothetical protein
MGRTVPYVIQDKSLHGTQGGPPEQIPCYTQDKNSVLVVGLPHHIPARHIWTKVQSYFLNIEQWL